MKRKNTRTLRHSSKTKSLSERSVSPDPFEQFHMWFQLVLKSDLPQPYAMTLATVSSNGHPSARVVLFKGIDRRGFTFYTNYESRKGKELSVNKHAALLFYWQKLERQVRIEGTVEKLSQEESYEYFSSRPRDSRIGAWASRQSEVIENRSILEAQFKKYKQNFRNADVPLPDFWGGYRLLPRSIEFWQSRPNRLHDRIAYVAENSSWKIVRLSP